MFTTYSYYIVFGMSLGFPSFLAGILSAPDFMDLSLSLSLSHARSQQQLSG